jgi:soluble lytic murein transglycosylase-like protein
MDALTALFLSATVQFHLPANLLASLCYVETRHTVNVVHENDGGSNSVGICQIKLKTAQWLGYKGTEKSLMIPRINIYYAAKYLAAMRDRYHGDIKKAIIAYNMGHAGNLTRTKYSDKVISQWRLVNE